MHFSSLCSPNDYLNTRFKPIAYKGPSTEELGDILKAAMSITEFKISDSQQKELEKIKGKFPVNI